MEQHRRYRGYGTAEGELGWCGASRRGGGGCGAVEKGGKGVEQEGGEGRGRGIKSLPRGPGLHAAYINNVPQRTLLFTKENINLPSGV